MNLYSLFVTVSTHEFVLMHDCLFVSQPVPTRDAEVIVRLRNCILALADQNMMLYDTSIMYAYEASTHYQVKRFLCVLVVKMWQLSVRQYWSLKGMAYDGQNRPILPAHKIGQQKSVVCHAKNQPILSADKIVQFYRPT